MGQTHKKFSREEDAELIRLIVVEDKGLRAAARALGRGSEPVRERAYRIAPDYPELAEVLNRRYTRKVGDDRGRLGRAYMPAMVAAKRQEPLPVGHPLTWGAITRGTCLEGQACV